MTWDELANDVGAMPDEKGWLHVATTQPFGSPLNHPTGDHRPVAPGTAADDAHTRDAAQRCRRCCVLLDTSSAALPTECLTRSHKDMFVLLEAR